ncbi:hypothetical protein EBZ39_12510 [bacterium]|nr:hypothetical protein [bacterium]
MAIFETVVWEQGEQVPCGTGRGATILYTGLPLWGWWADGGTDAAERVAERRVWADGYLKMWKLKFAKSTFRKRIFEILGTAHRSPNI